MARAAHIAPNRHATHPFDLRYGTDTGGYHAPHELRSGHRHDHMNNGYSAVAPSVFREACSRWRDTLSSSASRVEAYSFVDVGAGKGRAALLAAELPFRKVIAVELNGRLADTARRNLATWRRKAEARTTVRIIHQDAMEFRWPRGPLLIFLNNPFECALVEELAARITEARGRGVRRRGVRRPGVVDILYVNPGCADSLTLPGLFKLLWDAQIQMSEADQQADPYGAAADRVAAFRYRRDVTQRR